jgi:NADPH:quinone reductase-like Zn-dependent oxidoreductase
MFYRGQYLERAQLPSRLGYEAAGVVEAAGKGVDAQWIPTAQAAQSGGIYSIAGRN